MTNSTHILLYDDGCPLCTFQMKMITWMDWFNKVSLVPLSKGKARELVPNITREDLLAAVHCISKDGTIYRGARALRFVGMRMIPAFPIALIMWFPGIIRIAELVYAWVSKNRHLLSRMFGCKEACSILPTRERTNESQFEQKGDAT